MQTFIYGLYGVHVLVQRELIEKEKERGERTWGLMDLLDKQQIVVMDLTKDHRFKTNAQRRKKSNREKEVYVCV